MKLFFTFFFLSAYASSNFAFTIVNTYLRGILDLTFQKNQDLMTIDIIDFQVRYLMDNPNSVSQHYQGIFFHFEDRVIDVWNGLFCVVSLAGSKTGIDMDHQKYKLDVLSLYNETSQAGIRYSVAVINVLNK